MTKINWIQLRNTLREDLVALPHFLKNPVQGMREIPDWDWPTIFILQSAFALICSVLANLVERDFFGLVTGIVVAPLMNVILVTIGAGLFYYLAQFYFKREVLFRQVYLNVLFASIPLLIVTTVSFLLPPLILVGCAAFLLLLYVGFLSNFHFPPRALRQVLLVIMVAEILFWSFEQVQTSSRHKTLRLRATPESLDILEKELGH